MRAARRDPARIAPVCTDPYFDTEIPFDVCHDLYESLCKYLAKLNRYWIVFCPYHCDEAIRSTLASDLAEIWNDVKEAMCVYSKGSPRTRQHAIWMWRWSFHYHWGHRAVLAMNALAWLVSEAASNARDP